MINVVVGTPTKKAKLASYIDPDAGLSDDERDSGEIDKNIEICK